MTQACLQCSGSFDDSARLCPGCGYPAPVTPAEDSPVGATSEPVTIEISRQHVDSMSLTNPNNLIGAFVVFAVMVTVGLGMSGSKSSSSAAREHVTPAVAMSPKPDPSEKVQAIFEKMATSVAPVAIRASLIPRNLLDRERTERQIRGELENQLGEGWTVEATCYAGWCNIKLIHSIGEIWIDADKGIATKSIYLN